MKQCGAQDIPSLHALRKTQEHLQKNCGGMPTTRFVSSLGNILYLNDIPKIIGNVGACSIPEMTMLTVKSQDYANPQTAPLLQPYPEETSGLVSEGWQASRIREMPPDLLTPMFRKGLKDFFVNELAETISGLLLIPHM